MSDATPTDTTTDQETFKPFFFEVEKLPGFTIADSAGEGERADKMFDLFGRDLYTRPIVQTPTLCVYHETAKPNDRVKPHRHGTFQVNYILKGELQYGNQRITPNMGSFTPNTLYSWRAGPEGAEWIEIHGGQPVVYLDPPAG
jgi:hypothetical protein